MRSTLRGLCAALAFLWAGACGAPVSATDALPEPIQKDLCFEAGLHDKVQGHLLFSYFVTAQGRVEQPHLIYSKVEPADLESRLVGALRLCMDKWTFKPGTRGGRTERFTMMTPFHFFRPPPPDDPQVTLYSGEKIGLSRLEELGEAKRDLIQHLLSSREAKEVHGRGWVLRTDVGSADVKVALESFARAEQLFDAAFPGAPPVPPDREALTVIFRDGLSHAQVDAFDNLQPVQYGSAGKYSKTERLMYLYKASLAAPALRLHLLHEMTHHLMAQRLPGGVEFPSWIDEGVASLFECLRQDGKSAVEWDKFERGRIGSGPYVILRRAERNLKVLQEAARRGRLLPLAELMATPWQQFVGNDTDLLYAQSWLLVHYLFNAEGGRWRVPFTVWLMKEGRQEGPEGLAAAIGRPIEQIQADLPAYVDSLK